MHLQDGVSHGPEKVWLDGDHLPVDLGLEGLELLLVALRDDGVEEGSFGFLDLRFFPLVDVVLLDFEIDSLDAFRSAHNFDAAQEVLEIVQHGSGRLSMKLIVSLIKNLSRIEKNINE